MCCPGVSVPVISFLLHEQYNYFGFAFLFFSYCCLKLKLEVGRGDIPFFPLFII